METIGGQIVQSLDSSPESIAQIAESKNANSAQIVLAWELAFQYVFLIF